jgi:hypothetical protein
MIFNPVPCIRNTKGERRMAGMVIRSVRFGPRQADFITRMAEHEGVSASQYIRDAAYARAIFDAARRGDHEVALWRAMVEAAPELEPLVGLVLDEAE